MSFEELPSYLTDDLKLKSTVIEQDLELGSR
jgi:hypothetical protein